MNKAMSKADNIILMGDLNIDCHNVNDAEYDALDRFRDIFNFNNLLKEKSCFDSSTGNFCVFLTKIFPK